MNESRMGVTVLQKRGYQVYVSKSLPPDPPLHFDDELPPPLICRSRSCPSRRHDHGSPQCRSLCRHVCGSAIVACNSLAVVRCMGSDAARLITRVPLFTSNYSSLHLCPIRSKKCSQDRQNNQDKSVSSHAAV